jgi:hypothetical protein
MTSSKVALKTLLEDATYGVKVYDDGGVMGGATIANGTGKVTGSTLSLVLGVNTPTVTQEGTFTIVLAPGVIATVATGGWVVAASPVSLVAGTSTITVNAGGAGTITITVAAVPIILAGHIYTKWPGKREFGAAHAWIISIGPITGADSQLDALGAAHKWIKEFVQLDVWVLENKDVNYEAERVRDDLVKELDRCIHHYANAPGSGYKVANLDGWNEMDEVGVKRTTCRATVEWERNWA